MGDFTFPEEGLYIVRMTKATTGPLTGSNVSVEDRIRERLEDYFDEYEIEVRDTWPDPPGGAPNA